MDKIKELVLLGLIPYFFCEICYYYIHGGARMFETISNHLNEVLNIADKCPEKYQVKCFEVLLDALVKGEAITTAQTARAAMPSKDTFDFFQSHDISQGESTRVFHFDGNSFTIIVKDLKDKPTSKRQMKLGLLLGAKNLLETGQASVPKDILVDICKKYNAYDSTNFSTNMKNQKHFFLAQGNGWVLTIPGQEMAAQTVKELA
jgi:hypothetical protein